MNKTAKSHINPDDLKPALENLLRLAKSHGADEAEAVGANGRSLSIGVRGGVLEDIDNSEGKDIGLRVFVGQRQACVSSSDLSNDSLDKLAERCVAMAKLAPEDAYCGLADADKLAREKPELDIYDAADLNAATLLARAQELEAAALSVKGVSQAEGANAYCVKGAAYLMTTGGFSGGWRSSSHGLSVAAFASDGDNMERDYDYKSVRWLEDLATPESIGIKAGARAVARLGARQMTSANLPILFERRVANSLLSSFVSAISGSAIARGVSFLKDSMGEQVFHKHINITDDPYLVRAGGSHPWDGEGVAGKRLQIVENGVLKSWLMHSAAARQLGLETTGHAARGMSSPPGIACSNVWMDAGVKTPAALMKDMGKGLLITEMFGPSLNPNTGDYSVGIAGFAIENGERTYPVSEVTIAGNLLDMFKTIRAADDLKMDEPVATSSLLIESMVIAGA
ncbi:MAG: TldD/PmbA family protein [Robiginitomaculum sp.]|nr:TldD/PmbA family protein [Robiginitomaculum sp.]MCF6275196.1 TldD/PmbA family protein [Robiginitomaculum sp.]